MREHPILFSGEMIRAIHDDRKTQTRRVVKPQPTSPYRLVTGEWVDRPVATSCQTLPIAPRYCVGDTLWVRETWQAIRPVNATEWTTCLPHPAVSGIRIVYAADREQDPPPKWRPSIYMPRWASRLTLEITDVRIQRLQDISEEDAKAEGVEPVIDKKIHGWSPHCLEFSLLWDSINKDRGFSWRTNPWVRALTFKRVG